MLNKKNNMNPNEKARDLITKFNHEYDADKKEYILYQDVAESIRCALIVVEEVRTFHNNLFYASKNSIFDIYLDKVKDEIEKNENTKI